MYGPVLSSLNWLNWMVMIFILSVMNHAGYWIVSAVINEFIVSILFRFMVIALRSISFWFISQLKLNYELSDMLRKRGNVAVFSLSFGWIVKPITWRCWNNKQPKGEKKNIYRLQIETAIETFKQVFLRFSFLVFFSSLFQKHFLTIFFDLFFFY